MNAQFITLCTDNLRAVIDPGRGADIVSLVDTRTGVDVLFQTPWRAHANAVRTGRPPTLIDTKARWLEGYRGGWQTLCPLAGEGRQVHGAPVGFHGEAALIPWEVMRHQQPGTAKLRATLFSVPVTIERTVEVAEAKVTISDVLINHSSINLSIDYSHHPAFGGQFLEESCVLETGAQLFTSDPERAHNAPKSFAWPTGVDTAGRKVDLREIPASGVSREVFGWLHDFNEPWARIVNPVLGLGVRLTWDAEHLPYAWLWQELEATDDFPWFRRARAVAIEPASCPTSSSGRGAITLQAYGRTPLQVSVTLEDQRDYIADHPGRVGFDTGDSAETGPPA